MYLSFEYHSKKDVIAHVLMLGSYVADQNSYTPIKDDQEKAVQLRSPIIWLLLNSKIVQINADINEKLMDLLKKILQLLISMEWISSPVKL